ncbi:LysE family transporter [Paraburkholderia sediminicola]|uniref:LysE family transporter n=1 Tax=Paraburkholderia rhynchosiae TaxID=487049 RepID=A0ACC7NE02_9BURK
MVDGSAVPGVFAVYIAGVVIPGPNFVAVAHKAASATRFEALAVKVAGAAYLIWFGGRLIVNASAAQPASIVNAPAGGLRQAFVQGFATNIANPKSMAFFAAVFSSAAPAHVSIGTSAAMLGMVCVVASGWYGFVARTLSHARIAAAYRRGKAWADRVCGGLMVALGVRQLIR